MAKIDKSKLTKEQIEKALSCKTVDDLMKLAQTEGYEMTKDEAEAYMAEMADGELDFEQLDKVAGGVCWQHCVGPYKDVPCKAYCPVSMVG